MLKVQSCFATVSMFVAAFAALTSVSYGGEEKKGPLSVAYTSMGDSLILQEQGGDRPWVRLIGVGTPESPDVAKPNAFIAKAVPAVLESWTRGISVKLVDDPSLAPVPGGRRKVYAHRSPDGLDIGLALIQYGFAYARRDYSYERQAAYIAAEKRARDAGRGMWPKLMPIAVEKPPVSYGPTTAGQATGRRR